MNNRIDEIILEHGLHKAECYSRMKMLAELIVRECAGLVRGHPHFDKMLDCATVIKQHFGVES